jgi:hypothetical protein
LGVCLLTCVQDFSIISAVMCHTVGRAMAEVVSRRPLTAEARVNPCGICGGQSGTGTGFSPNSLVFPCQYHSTAPLQTHITWRICNMLTYTVHLKISRTEFCTEVPVVPSVGQLLKYLVGRFMSHVTNFRRLKCNFVIERFERACVLWCCVTILT